MVGLQSERISHDYSFDVNVEPYFSGFDIVDDWGQIYQLNDVLGFLNSKAQPEDALKARYFQESGEELSNFRIVDGLKGFPIKGTELDPFEDTVLLSSTYELDEREKRDITQAVSTVLEANAEEYGLSLGYEWADNRLVIWDN